MSTRTELDQSRRMVVRELERVARSPDASKQSWRRIRDRVLSAANTYRVYAGEEASPIDPEALADLCGVKKIEQFGHPDSPEAVLLPAANGFIIKLRPDLFRTRRRYTVAHELGHTFFYDLNSSPPKHFLGVEGRGQYLRKEEGICHEFAAEILMPRALVESFRNEYIGTPCDLTFITASAVRFDVSFDVAVRRTLWNLDEFKAVTVIVATLNEESKTSNVRRFLGRDIKAPLKSEKQILTALHHHIATANIAGIESIMHSHEAEATFEARRETDHNQNTRVVVLVDFARGRHLRHTSQIEKASEHNAQTLTS